MLPGMYAVPGSFSRPPRKTTKITIFSSRRVDFMEHFAEFAAQGVFFGVFFVACDPCLRDSLSCCEVIYRGEVDVVIVMDPFFVMVPQVKVKVRRGS